MSRSKEIRKRKFLLSAAVVLFMIFLSVLSFVSYRRELKETLEQKTREDLEKTTNQSNLLINNIVDNGFDKLDIAGTFCRVNSGIYDDEIIKMIRDTNRKSLYIQIGVVDGNGILYTGDDEPLDVSQKEYFRRAIAGEKYISDVEMDEKTGVDTIILSEPIWQKGEIAGVICCQYNINMFTEFFGTSQFQGYGATLIMQKNGSMVSSYQGMERFQTFYDALEEMEFRDGYSLEGFRSSVKKGESGFLTYYKNNNARYVYYKNTGIKDWVVISLVMAESFDTQFHIISSEALVLMGENLIFYTIIICCIIFILRQNNKVLLDNQIDSLTKVYNKASAMALMEQYLLTDGKGKMNACFFIDIDNFKKINDSLGHAAGDKILADFAVHLKSCVRQNDVIGRFGGDEFVVFVKNIPSKDIAVLKASLLLNLKGDLKEHVTISIGISMSPGDGNDYEILLQKADEAMYQAKTSGKGRFMFYDSIETGNK